MSSTRSNPTACSGKRSGRGARQRKAMKFREKKNAEFMVEMRAALLKRLGVTETANDHAIQNRSSVVPTMVPVSFRGLPIFVKGVWNHLKSLGPEPFQDFVADELFPTFVKCFMYICEAKVAFAQFMCQPMPHLQLTSRGTFTIDQLCQMKSMASLLPKPLAIYVESIGTFTVDEQLVVPMLVESEPAVASGAVSFAPSQVVELMKRFIKPLPVDATTANTVHISDDLPGIDWVYGEKAVQPEGLSDPPPPPPNQIQTVAIHHDSIEKWSFPTPSECETFKNFVSSIASVHDYVTPVDISLGGGSIVQLVRFPERFDASAETSFYTNARVPDFEMKLAPALQLGFEHQCKVKSRFSTSFDTCLFRGSADSESARDAVIWSSPD